MADEETPASLEQEALDALESAETVSEQATETPEVPEVSEATPVEDDGIPPEPPEDEELPNPASEVGEDFLQKFDEANGTQFSKKFKSVEDLANAHTELESRIGQRDEAAAAWREFEKNPERYREAFFGGQSPQTPQTEQELTIDQVKNWQTQVRRGEDGSYEPLPGAEPGVVENLARAERQIHEKIIELALNPPSQPTFDPNSIDERVQQTVGQYLAQYQQQVAPQIEASNIIESNKHWLYTDPNNPSPQTLSRRGQAYMRYAKEGEEMGITDVKKIDQYAREKMQLVANKAATRTTPPTNTRSASEPAVEEVEIEFDDDLDLFQNAMAALEKAGAKL